MWIASTSTALSSTAREIFRNPDNAVFLSSVSAWEIALKNTLGRLPLPEPPQSYVPRLCELHGIEPLTLEEEAALHLPRIPDHHEDPFDRMLICQAIIGGMVLLTPDRVIARYPARVRW